MTSLTRGIFLVGAKRTPFATFGGKFVEKSVIDLQEIAAKAAMAVANVKPEWIDSVIIGNIINSASADAPYVARHVLLRCKIPIERPALAVNRLCGSGFQAIVTAAHEILMGDSRVVLTGGTENMSQAPYAVRGMRFGTRLGAHYHLDDTLWSSLSDLHAKIPMGVTAENLAEQYNVTREEADLFAYNSQMKWADAQEKGYFKEEIVPVEITVKKKSVIVDFDEHPKPKTTLEGLAKLPSVFKKNGTVTAGTASGISDGAGAVVVAGEDACKEYNLKPLARLVGYAVAGVEPTIMGIGPVPTIKNLLKKANMKINDIDLIDINEAFAPQVMACQRALDINPDIFNVKGGAIALGHPLAASGARITAHLVHEMRRRGVKYSIGSACIGGGQGIALLFENCF